MRAKIDIPDLARELCESYSESELKFRKQLLGGLKSILPGAEKLKVFAAIELALVWKQYSDERSWQIH